MSDEKSKDASNKETDKELSDLLDSALSDFDKESDKPTTTKKSEDKPEEEPELSEEWSEELIQQAAAQFQTNMAELLKSLPEDSISENQLEQSFKKMAEAAQQVLTNPSAIPDSAPDFTSTITQTLQGLSEGRENLQNPFSEQDIMSMFSGDGGSGTGDQNAFLPFMQGMLQSLLSKEVLFPVLKDITERFPGWLEENGEGLAPEDRDRYIKQKELMEEVCNVLESESPNDSNSEKGKKFEKVLGLMQRLQEFGDPPKDLVREELPQVPLGDLQNPDQCSMM